MFVIINIQTNNSILIILWKLWKTPKNHANQAQIKFSSELIYDLKNGYTIKLVLWDLWKVMNFLHIIESYMLHNIT